PVEMPVPPIPLIHASIENAGEALSPAAAPMVTWSSTPSRTRDLRFAAVQVSVVHASPSVQSGSDRHGGFTLLHVPAEQVSVVDAMPSSQSAGIAQQPVNGVYGFWQTPPTQASGPVQARPSLQSM